MSEGSGDGEPGGSVVMTGIDMVLLGIGRLEDRVAGSGRELIELARLSVDISMS
jgi:hypothetical protein